MSERAGARVCEPTEEDVRDVKRALDTIGAMMGDIAAMAASNPNWIIKPIVIEYTSRSGDTGLVIGIFMAPRDECSQAKLVKAFRRIAGSG